ncbi:MAG: hypothetical protein JRI36_06005 [Deltaproteobacteria bacterium]|nr:hypothetical protein [Deltaproteobacteria bacterium]
MSAQIIKYNTKQGQPIFDWDWMRCEIDPEPMEIPVMGTVAAGRPIEAIPYRQTISIPKDMVGRFQVYALTYFKHPLTRRTWTDRGASEAEKPKKLLCHAQDHGTAVNQSRLIGI